ncbi:type IV pilus modification protein PilV [Bowmanella denitrificans]|uniref:type IV pilus modification protein PilV n=1 Tax=Bowmanella denitrificans TaxID=366582 RepID=UPI002481C44A|nr:type IV pilus modification protein PilV [Bowmanella denitrificans]
MSATGMKLPNQQVGVGMIEILVTLFILSIGLLGVASLQFIGSFSNADALNRSQAVIITQQLAERLRASAKMSNTANSMVVDNSYFTNNLYNFDNLGACASGNTYNCYCLAIPAAIPDCSSGQCTPGQFAEFDAYEVSCSMAATNPAANINLTCSDNDLLDADACSAGSRHRIMISWPAANWQNIDRQLNALCNPANSNDPRDCVVLDVTL